jgi:hypothetical protein
MMPSAIAWRNPRARERSALKLRRGATFGEVSNAALPSQSRAKLPNAATGTALAINNLSLGVAAQSAVRSGRGGNRNRADRETHALTKAHIGNLSAAEGHSRVIGLPITRMITIHWKAAGVPLPGMAAATGKFVDHLTRWLARRGYRIAWLWVHENAGDKGWHCHLLASVPAELVKPLVAAQKRWLRAITGRPYHAKVIHSDPIGGRLRLETGNPELHFANARAALAYICKGAPQSALDAAGIDRRHKAQGRIIGRRCSTSQNIGKAQRKAHHGQKD